MRLISLVVGSLSSAPCPTTQTPVLKAAVLWPRLTRHKVVLPTQKPEWRLPLFPGLVCFGVLGEEEGFHRGEVMYGILPPE